jgi:hypothetical protein
MSRCRSALPVLLLLAGGALVSAHQAVPRFAPPGDFARTQVGDESDTSPFRADASATGISTNTYIRNMSALIRFLDSRRQTRGQRTPVPLFPPRPAGIKPAGGARGRSRAPARRSADGSSA